MPLFRTLAAALALVFLCAPALAAEKETAYERVMRTGTIRCGYIIWPPFMDKDVKTGAFSGMNYDYVTAIAQSLDLKIDWIEEVQVGQSVEALRSGKIDAICTAEGPLFPSTTKYLSYSKAFAYFPFFLYARGDDRRFDADIKAADAPNIRLAVIDGDISSEIAKTFFPKAERHAIAQMASSQMYQDVVSGKADLLIDGPIVVNAFLKSNPGALRRVPTREPLSVIPNTFSVLRGPQGADLVAMLDQAIDNLRNSGREAKIFAPYLGGAPDILYPVTKPYRSEAP